MYIMSSSQGKYSGSPGMTLQRFVDSAGEHSGELDLVKDEYGSFPMDGGCQVHWVSFLDGRQRVLLFTEDVAVVAKARQAEDLEQFQQEFSVSLQNLGLSLINNKNKREIAYVGITSSGVVWEMKPKNRWKSFNVKNISLLEKTYQNHISAAKEPSWVKIESNLEMDQEEPPGPDHSPPQPAPKRPCRPAPEQHQHRPRRPAPHPGPSTQSSSP